MFIFGANLFISEEKLFEHPHPNPLPRQAGEGAGWRAPRSGNLIPQIQDGSTAECVVKMGPTGKLVFITVYTL